MKIEFNNGASVSRVWKEGAVELMAAFQHVGLANLFASAVAKDETQPRDVDFIVSDHRNGQLTVHKQPSVAVALESLDIETLDSLPADPRVRST